MKLQRITVFCGSSPGGDPAYAEAARALGARLAQEGIGIVYGGGRVGMMGQLAQAALDQGGEVIGVITRHLYNMEVGHTGTDLRIVGDMHRRKADMAELGDGFIMLPGGLGSLDEFFEAATWSQLGLHAKPCGILNVNGYFDRLLEFLDHAKAELFMAPQARSLVHADIDIDALLSWMRQFEPTPPDKGAWAKALSRLEA